MPQRASLVKRRYIKYLALPFYHVCIYVQAAQRNSTNSLCENYIHARERYFNVHVTFVKFAASASASVSGIMPWSQHWIIIPSNLNRFE